MSLRRAVPPILALALVSTACASGSGKGADTVPTRPAQNAATAELLPTDVAALPSFDYATYQALLGQLKGTPVVVNFWASWCGPCRGEAPDLASAARTYGSRVQFLGVDILDSRSSAAGFIEEFRWPYPSVFDASGDIRDRLGFIGQPVTVFYDASGKLASSWNGPLTPDVLQERIEQILGPGTSAG